MTIIKDGDGIRSVSFGVAQALAAEGHAEIVNHPEVDPLADEPRDDDAPGGGVASAEYDAMSKADLVALAEQRGLDSTGSKADIIERLRGA